MSATPDVRRRADTTTAENEESESEDDDDDSEPSEGKGEGELEGQGHPTVVITPSLEKATEEAIQILDASLPPSPDEAKPDPFVVAAVVHANGDSRRVRETKYNLF